MAKIIVGGSGRIHSGGKISQEVQDFNRANHNLSKTIRATIAPGAVVPVYRKRVKPGDTFDFEDIEIALYTDPTERAMYGHYTAYIEFFYSPTRLKQAWLHNNKEYIGEDMSQVKLPIFNVEFNKIIPGAQEQIDIQQISPSSLLAHMGTRSAGRSTDPGAARVRIIKNAEKIIDYYDIYKNYYANRQEKKGWIIDYSGRITTDMEVTLWVQNSGVPDLNQKLEPPAPEKGKPGPLMAIESNKVSGNAYIIIRGKNISIPNDQLYVNLTNDATAATAQYRMGSGTDPKYTYDIDGKITQATFTLNSSEIRFLDPREQGTNWRYKGTNAVEQQMEIGAGLSEFPITNIDDMREDILAAIKNPNHFTIDEKTYAPYGNNFAWVTKKIINEDGAEEEMECTASYYPMQGLALCTYKSDRNNNWLDSEYIDRQFGQNGKGIVDVTEGLNLNALLLAQKIFNQTNKIAIGNRSYNEWLNVIHGQEIQRPCEIPVYEGGVSQNIYFEELRSTAAQGDQPIGTIVANGVMGREKNGGKVVIRCEEAGLIYAMMRIVPNIIYSQGNDPDDDILTMDDIHQPDLDGIGYQDMVTEYFAAADTVRDPDGTPHYRSVGKQPAWLNYMTDVDEAFGDFAIRNNKMSMTLNRNYTYDKNGEIKDATTYIDPSKYNYMWAGVARNDMHFDVSVGMKITARRKLSTRQMPNF